jgi:acyl-[acyl-carrier-protein]-phospholipid O-acyltransferase/long-chain-fatty-acid--[acyl-carrier-protein] ligase
MTARQSPLAGLLAAQFTGAFNDNAWKCVMTLLAQRQVAPGDVAGAQRVTTLALVLFTLPLALGSLPAGAIVDRVSKSKVLAAMKAVEVALMIAGALALAIWPEGGIAGFAIVALMGLQSALFSAAKLGILPEILPHEELSEGNGKVEFATMLAIVLGTAAGGAMLEASGARPWLVGVALTVSAVCGLVGSLRIPVVPAARVGGGVVETIASAASTIRADRILTLTVIGSVMFWCIASLLLQNLLVYGQNNLQLPEQLYGVPAGVLSIGIGIGCVIAGKLSAKKVEFGLLPLGAGMLALFTLLFGSIEPKLIGTLVWMVAIGSGTGLLLVPLEAILQWRSPKDRRGAVVALANVFVFLAMLGGSLASFALAKSGLSTGHIFIVAGIAVALGAAWALWLVPQALARLVLLLLTHSLYRVRVVGAEHVPEKGGALLVPNHVSFMDAMLIAASTDRPVRFLADAPLFDKPLVGAGLRWFNAIPISSSGGPRMILRALRNAGDTLDQGHVVCIFAEGQITRTGMLNSFRRGMERIVKGRSAPIVPVYLDRVWGSIFSFAEGRFFWKLPQKIPYPVGVSFGEPLAAGTPLARVRRAVQELGERAWSGRRGEALPLHRSFVSLARRGPHRLAFADAKRPRVSRMRALTGAIAFARALRPRWSGQERVGILLPPCVPGALVNIAASLGGHTVVNLNYTAGKTGMESAARQSALKTVVTSREFIDKAKLEVPAGVEPIWIEELATSIGPGARLAALALAWCAPARALERACGATRAISPNDVATVIFSSGSTGEPKGVLLTHANIDSNVAMIAQVFRVGGNDKVLGVLPFFHSFGYTTTIWFAANRGLAAIYHPSPIDGPAIGELVERYAITFMLATPTLLSIYMRRCTPAQFGSLRVVLAGAEKLPERLLDAFEDHFGIRPLEGYGATECAPVIAVSALDYRAPGFYQPGWRRGFVGQPLPGIALRVVDPETFAELPPNTPGMLLVKGPNVMRGYLGRDDLTQQVLRDGWYVTGDIAMLDDDSFLKITDRLSRFSKIGGEMVPHGRVEEELHRAAGASTPVFCVAGVPDEKKGERLAVVTTIDLALVPQILEKLARAGLPNLFIPRADAFVHVAALPLLGTGKTDLRAVKQLALEGLKSSR